MCLGLYVCLFDVRCLSWRANSSKSCGYFKMALTTALLISFGLMSTVRCLPGGPVTASAELCSGSIMPKHHTTAQKTTAPYKINVPTCYKAGSPVKGVLFVTSCQLHNIRNVRSMAKALH